jgi:hypothetical protein
MPSGAKLSLADDCWSIPNLRTMTVSPRFFGSPAEAVGENAALDC